MSWNLFSSRQQRRPERRRPGRQAMAVEQLEPRLAPAGFNVLTYHDDIASTGLNPTESQLTPANVKVGSFTKRFTVAMDGEVYAEPLVDTGITIASGPNTSTGAAGLHDVVFVATQHDSLYAIDSSIFGGAILWKRRFIDITRPYSGSTPGTNINNTLSATAITSVPSGDTGTGDISPEVGITGTPVIDPASGTLYVVVKTRETVGSVVHYVQRLHAINVADGTDLAIPYLIGDTTNGNSNNTKIYAYGSGDGSVTDPYNGTGAPVVQLNALREAQRGALSLVNNAVYVEWASHGDNGPYHGWVAKWDVSNLVSGGFQLKGVLCTSPNDGLSGIWQGGGRLAFEADGSAFYFETGNGSGGAPVLNANGFPTNANYNEALVKVVADPTTGPSHQNPNGWGLKVADYFIPYNVAPLDNADSDFGSGAPMLLPDSAGIAGHPHLMVAAGKEGKIYLVDRDNMGKFDPANDHVLNAVANGSGNKTPPVQLGGSLSTAAYYNSTIYWTSGYSSSANAYKINANGTLSVKSQTAINNFGYLPGSVVVSANGTTGGVVWVMDRNLNQIHAYDAATLSTQLWNSSQKVGGGDNLGSVVKFAVPTVVNGEVYVGTSNSLVVYGLANPATAVPNAPSVSAATLSGSSINLTWTDNTAPPNNATGYSVEDSTDGITFHQVATAPAGSTSIAIGSLQPLTKYYFRMRGFNGLGSSPYSNMANATTTNQVAIVDFSAGFAGSLSKLTLNGSTAINGTRLELTNASNQAGSAFAISPVDVTRFTTQFTFQLSAGTNTADGFTFTIQGVGPNALGLGGGGLGYGAITSGGSGGIGNSVAVKFDLYSNQGEGFDSTGLYTNGAPPMNAGSIDLTSTGVNLHSGDVLQVNMTYDGTTLTVVIKDTQTGSSATQNYTINIPGTVGGSTAYVGFTGGTGGLKATQDILTWTFAPNAPSSPNAPSGLGAAPASATSVALNWTNNATNQTGFHLDRATDAGFTQNLITENLPAAPNTFTDTVTGLAPGNTFYYRLRAYNAAGDSGNSNPASVTIPLAPPIATNLHVTGVTASEIDLSWQDNAGHKADGYHIFRAINHGSFTQVASLPPTSRTPPSTYLWSDINLTPGTFYDYHIVAYNVSGNNDVPGINATTLTSAPTGLTALSGNGVINLFWSAAAGALSYDIYRGTAAGQEGATPIATGLTATSYSDTMRTNGVTYYYTVTAVNANAAPLPAESAPSAEASATPADPAGRLVVTSTTPTATGFTVTFSRPFVPADLTLYGSGAPVQDVTLTGAASGPLPGTLLVDPSNQSIAFKATASFLAYFFTNPVLPDDTYTVTLVSRPGPGGFHDASGADLDGAKNGGHANFTTTFTTANGAKSILALPDFARGPDAAHNIQIPNDNGQGIPITLYNAAGVKDVAFTLSYNPALLTISGAIVDPASPSGSSFTAGKPILIDATHATIEVTFHNDSAQNGTVLLGDIVANVPASAAAIYKAKELLGFGTILVNGAAFSGIGANAIHVNAYFGDVTGNGAIDGLDLATANTVATGTASGFNAFTLLDPAVVGDVADDISVDAGDVSELAAFIVHLPTPRIPAIPTGLTITPVGADPTLSLGEPQRQRENSYSPGRLVTVPVLLDHPHPEGSAGMTEAVLALTYDPGMLSVSPADITLGSIPTKGEGWQINSVIDAAAGRIGIQLYSTTSITATQAGSLVNIAFHLQGAPSSPITMVHLVDSVIVNGQQFATQVDDPQGQYVLGPSVNRLAIQTGPMSAGTAAAVRSEGRPLVTSMFNNRQIPLDGLSQAMSDETEMAYVLGPEVNDALTAQFPSPLFLIGSLPVPNGIASRQVIDWLFVNLARRTAPGVLAQTESSADVLPNTIWDGAAAPWNWQAVSSQVPDYAEPALAQPSSDQRAFFDRLDRAFADLADEDSCAANKQQ